MAKNNLLGSWGEEKAAEYYRKLGYDLVALNYSCRFGEIDLIVKRRKYLVFVEVKLRRDAAFAQAREFVDRNKQERVKKTAMVWLENHETDLQPRFDVLEIYAKDGMNTVRPQFYRIEDAF